ncbi:MAG: glycoside hydrolase family 3 C-terminal domain-containing protein [Clostridiales bacterium]|jgi:beta-glucosidase|nr:glycoside hydrolase family 3 C-terminal domain-containing protein [Clostridiales bacterium]
MKKRTSKLLVSASVVLLSLILGFTAFACNKSKPGPELTVPSYEGTVGADGTKSGFTENGGKFYKDYNTKDEMYAAGKDLNIRLAEEGNVLLKNAGGVLPLSADERSVSLFGIKSTDIQTGGGGSGAGTPGGYGVPTTSLQKGMEDAGFRVNPKLLTLYANNLTRMSYTVQTAGGAQTLTTELPIADYPNTVLSSYRSYDDAAIVTFARTGAEGYDLLMHDVPGHADKSDHILQLSDGEEALIRHVKKSFKKVIVLINSSNIMEVGDLNEEKTADNLGVDAILWIGHTGNDGAAAVGRILNGSVNPSGHTADIWPADFKKGPSWSNFGDNGQNKDGSGAAYDNKMYVGDTDTGYRSVEYREGIYIGYRYYETVATDKNAAESESGENWYNQEVVFPFGYGLSYTDFAWELDPSIAKTGLIDKANGIITVKVKVTNTGDAAGKDVVQVYASAPYTKGGIEKASATLVGFAKTKILKPGESQTVTVEFIAQDMASFDWNDKNGNGFVGYELEAGDYVISARRDSHTVAAFFTRTVKDGIKCETDSKTGNKIEPVFSASSGVYTEYNSVNDVLKNNLMSRDGMTLPTPSTKADRTISQSQKDLYDSRDKYYAYQDDPSDPWYVNGVPSGWTQSDGSDRVNGKTATQIGDMSGVSYTDPSVVNGAATAVTDDGSKKWDAFMNQLTWDELCQLVSEGRYGRQKLDSIGKPVEFDLDGPAHFGWISSATVVIAYINANEKPEGMGTCWVTAVVVASTWNTELAEEVGVMVGNESLFTNITGWYGPSMNTHRSPFGGRNFEYYSEDGVLAGKIAAATVLGATSKGVVCYLKHIFLNDQETNRDTKRGVFTWATEQAIREIYARPFEYAIKDGRATGTMSASNRIGGWVAFGNFALYDGLLRGEWGFKGINITDSWNSSRAYSSVNHLVRNGVDCPLGNGSQADAGEYGIEKGVWDAAAKTVRVKASADATEYTLASPTQYYNVRKAAQHMLYVSANSNGIDNGLKTIPDIVIEYDGLAVVKDSLLNYIDTAAVGMTAMDSVSVKNGTGSLPTGLSLDSAGAITGTATASGTYSVIVEFNADEWVKKSVNLTITVKADVFSFTGANTATTSAAYSGSFSTAKYAVGQTIVVQMSGYSLPATVTAVSYAAADESALPTGLAITDGTLAGTPTTAGTYTFSVKITVNATISMYGMTMPTSPIVFTQTYTIIIS